MTASTLLPVTASSRKKLKAAVERYEMQISLELDDWLAGRGLEDGAVSGARLGEVDDPFPEHEAYKGWLVIPYLDKDGEPLTMRFRRPDWYGSEDRAKYKSLPHDPARLYNIRAIHSAAGAEMHVTEGELDALILEQAGYPAVAIPGANNFKPHHARMLAGFTEIYLWPDGDKAGAELAATMSKYLRDSLIVLTLPNGEDVNSLYLKGGEAALESTVKEWGNGE